jgi:acyl carrier protein
VDEQFGIAIPDRFVEEGSPDLWRSVSDIARTVESLLTVSTGA